MELSLHAFLLADATISTGRKTLKDVHSWPKIMDCHVRANGDWKKIILWCRLAPHNIAAMSCKILNYIIACVYLINIKI